MGYQVGARHCAGTAFTQAASLRSCVCAAGRNVRHRRPAPKASNVSAPLGAQPTAGLAPAATPLLACANNNIPGTHPCTRRRCCRRRACAGSPSEAPGCTGLSGTPPPVLGQGRRWGAVWAAGCTGPNGTPRPIESIGKKEEGGGGALLRDAKKHQSNQSRGAAGWRGLGRTHSACKQKAATTRVWGHVRRTAGCPGRDQEHITSSATQASLHWLYHRSVQPRPDQEHTTGSAFTSKTNYIGCTLPSWAAPSPSLAHQCGLDVGGARLSQVAYQRKPALPDVGVRVLLLGGR